MSDETPSLEELRRRKDEMDRQLAEAERAEAERPGMSVEEATEIFTKAVEDLEAVEDLDEKYEIAAIALKKLEDGKAKGKMVDWLAQVVINNRA